MRKRKHSRKYVERIIANESCYTRADVVRVYRQIWRTAHTYNDVIEKLTLCDVDTIRWVLRLGKYAE